jgi:hypothetical protein
VVHRREDRAREFELEQADLLVRRLGGELVHRLLVWDQRGGLVERRLRARDPRARVLSARRHRLAALPVGQEAQLGMHRQEVVEMDWYRCAAARR